MKILRTSVMISVGILLCSLTMTGQPTPTYVLYGPSGLDLSTCSQEGPVGRVTETYWVVRGPDVSGPTQVSLSGLPTDVTATISPSILTFPGAVTSQQVTVVLTVNAGVTINDTVIQMEVADTQNKLPAQLLLYGTCPRHNRDFTIRGSFFSVQIGKLFPVEGALVEIYRDVPWRIDQWVGSTLTEADGTFDLKLWAGEEDTYYAKLRLNDVAGVYLHDWWTPSIKDYNSYNRGSNSQPVIDLGNTVIIKDSGTGTPKSTVWQGGRTAFQEFIRTLGTAPPTGDYQIVNQNTASGIVWTARSTTNYEEGVPTYNSLIYSSPVAPTEPGFRAYFSQFRNYSTSFHEFGHALRHTVDGDIHHFNADSGRWTYGRVHNWCGSSLVDVEGFAFNEGWAEFWAMDTGWMLGVGRPNGWCPSLDLSDMTKEGSVMNDLHNVAQAIDGCLPVVVDRAERTKQQRRNLFNVLNRGQNIIHSQGEFRNNAAQQFPGCAFQPVGIGVAATPLIAEPANGVRWLAPTKIELIRRIRERAEFYRGIRQKLVRELVSAKSEARRSRDCKSIPCETFIARLIHPTLVEAKIAYASLIATVFRERYREELVDLKIRRDFSQEASERERAGRDSFREATLKIVINMLKSSERLLKKASGNDSTGRISATATDITRIARRLQLQGPRNNELFAILELPTPPRDDTTIPRFVVK